jgi:predicted RNase H-like nuclease (RuvC/YqgF family)
MNSFFQVFVSSFLANPFAIINLIAIMIILTFCFQQRLLLKQLFSKITWVWYIALASAVVVIYSNTILDIVKNPPSYSIILAVFVAFLTIITNSFKEKVDLVEKISNKNNEQTKELILQSTKLEKQTVDLNKKSALLRRGNMNTANQVTELRNEFIRLEKQVKDLDVKVNNLDVKVNNLDVKVNNLDVKVNNLDVKITEIGAKTDNIGLQVSQILALLQK